MELGKIGIKGISRKVREAEEFELFSSVAAEKRKIECKSIWVFFRSYIHNKYPNPFVIT